MWYYFSHTSSASQEEQVTGSLTREVTVHLSAKYFIHMNLAVHFSTVEERTA
jgi:hypothetical protein